MDADSYLKRALDSLTSSKQKASMPIFKSDIGFLQPKRFFSGSTGDGSAALESCISSYFRNPTYGPGVGATRLERYERAIKLGLKPPAIVSCVHSFRLPEAYLFRSITFLTLSRGRMSIVCVNMV